MLKLSDALEVAKDFGADFINPQGEIILNVRWNVYAGTNGVESKIDLETWVVMSMTRPICKGIPTKAANQMLGRLNRRYGTELTREDVGEMYRCLCYRDTFDGLKRFISDGFPIERIEEYGRVETPA